MRLSQPPGPADLTGDTLNIGLRREKVSPAACIGSLPCFATAALRLDDCHAATARGSEDRAARRSLERFTKWPPGGRLSGLIHATI